MSYKLMIPIHKERLQKIIFAFRDDIAFYDSSRIMSISSWEGRKPTPTIRHNTIYPGNRISTKACEAATSFEAASFVKSPCI